MQNIYIAAGRLTRRSQTRRERHFMDEQMIRTVRLIGESAVQRLTSAGVLLFGVGGVGSFAAEALARAGVGRMTLVDGDRVALSNLNRQLVALHSTIGRGKADVMAERIRDINPTCQVTALGLFFGKENPDAIDFSGYDYVVDAIDSVSAKLLIAEKCRDAGTPLISCMGTGNKLDPTRFVVTDISKTHTCPLARVMRRELHRRGIDHLKVLYSLEPARVPDGGVDGDRRTPASISFVPPVAGMILAGEVIRDLAGLAG